MKNTTNKHQNVLLIYIIIEVKNIRKERFYYEKNLFSLLLCTSLIIPTIPVNALEVSKVSRVSGVDRVMTSIETSKYVNSQTLIITSGYSFADSLSASNVANATGGAVVLVDKKTDVYSHYKNKNIQKIYIVGGMVSGNVIASARRLTSNIKILEGDDRYATNEKTLSEFGFTSVGVADGRNYQIPYQHLLF